MNLQLIILTAGLIFMGAFAVSIFLFIVIRRIVLQKKQVKTKKIKDAIEKNVLKSFTSGTEEAAKQIASRYSSYPNILATVLVDFIETLTGEQRKQLKIIFNHALREKTLKDINSCWIRKRLRATRIFIMFSSSYDSPQIIKLLKDKPAVRLAAIDSLARVPNEEAFSQIFDSFAKDPDPNIQEYMNVMFSLGQKSENLIKKYLKKPLSLKKKDLLIEIIGAIPLPNLFPELLMFSNHPEMEIRASTARALGNLNTPLPEIIQTLMNLAQDESWEVKAQALKGLGKLQSQSALDVLTESLYSSNWYCRLNAGFALLQLGKRGIERLKQISSQKKDKYAAQMAQMVLEESIIA